MSECICTSLDKLAGNFCYWCQLAVVSELTPSMETLERDMEVISKNIVQQLRHDEKKHLEGGMPRALTKGRI